MLNTVMAMHELPRQKAAAHTSFASFSRRSGCSSPSSGGLSTATTNAVSRTLHNDHKRQPRQMQEPAGKPTIVAYMERTPVLSVNPTQLFTGRYTPGTSHLLC
jgi:hypothetical protein